MKKLHENIRQGEIRLKIENTDDLWTLSQIIDQGDIVKGKTIRKIKIGEKEQRKQKVIKKTVFLKLKVEKLEFSSTSTFLRVSGIIEQGPEDIQKGTHHTFNLEENSIITIIKEKWLKFQLGRIKDACTEKVAKILICVFDREEAYIALMKKYGYELLTHIKGNVRKKGDVEKKESTFYKELITKLEDYTKRYQLQKIILASPSFWKEELMKELKNDELKSRIIQATCSSVGKSAINEVLKRDELKQAMREDRIVKEINLVEDLLTEISKDNLAAYGIKDTENAVNAGAVEKLLVTDSLIQKSRQQDKYKKLENIMKITESTNGSVNIISSEHDGGKKLNGLGGIGAILRYKLSY